MTVQIFSQKVAREIAKKYLCAKCWGGLALVATDLTFQNVEVRCDKCGPDKGLITRSSVVRLIANDQENYYLAIRNLKYLLDIPKIPIELKGDDVSMPINTIRQQLLFPPIGHIRKGQAQEEVDKGYPKDLDYFRLVFNEGEEVAAAAAEQVFGPEPKELEIVFPYNDIERIWDYWLKAYASNRCIAVSDGTQFLYWLDNDTNKVKARNGVMAGSSEPAIYSKNMVVGITRDSRKPIYCKPVGKLTVIFPQIASTVSRLAPMILHTSSWNDIAHITNLLESYSALAGSHGLPLAGCKMLLRREWRQISYAPNPSKPEDRKSVKKSLVTIDIIDERWKGLLWEQIQEKAFAVAEQADYTESFLPEGAYTDADIVDGAYTPPEVPSADIDQEIEPPENIDPASDPDYPESPEDYQGFYEYALQKLRMSREVAYEYLSRESNMDAQEAFIKVKKNFVEKVTN